MPGFDGFRETGDNAEASGVSSRTALTVVIATITILIILYELINWRPG
ncbi:MAG: hypothetical protein LC772_07080 [Chloroflexi bacterium]|nr:hypothetical protein [Chloroflexota bacterium]